MSETSNLTAALRRRIHLDVVSPDEARGIRVSSGHPVMYRGCGGQDYACGACGVLIAIGVQPGVLRSVLFECACGAMNRVPPRAG